MDCLLANQQSAGAVERLPPEREVWRSNLNRVKPKAWTVVVGIVSLVFSWRASDIDDYLVFIIIYPG